MSVGAGCTVFEKGFSFNFTGVFKFVFLDFFDEV